MRVSRVFVDQPLAVGARVPLPERAATHLVRVLRLGVGDACVLFNGDGSDYDARLVAADRRGAEVLVGDAHPVDNESPLRITLVQGIARGEKMDWILQKATELGVTSFVPVHSERSEVRLDGERAARRHAHWSGVVVGACEQSGRARVPPVAAPAPLAQALQGLPAGTRRLLLDPTATSTTATASLDTGLGCVLAVGPEGGWSPGDRAILAAADFEGVRLGPRILRTETAGIAAVVALQSRHGDLAG